MQAVNQQDYQTGGIGGSTIGDSAREWLDRNKLGAKHNQPGSARGLQRIWNECPHPRESPSIALLLAHIWRAAHSIFCSPFSSLLSVLCIAVSLTVCCAAMLLVENIARGLHSANAQFSLALVLKDSAGDEQVQNLVGEVQDNPAVKSFRIVSKDAALQWLAAQLGEEAILLQGLEENNPLPRMMEIELKAEQEGQARTLIDAVSRHPAVELTQYDQGFLGQVSKLLQDVSLAGSVTIAVILILAAFVIASVISLGLYAHRDEIEIMRLIGASDRYVRAPFLVEGVIQGFAGAILALAASSLLLSHGGHYLETSLFGLLSVSEMKWLTWPLQLLVLLTGIVVGFLGSLFALIRFKGA